jgi:hypothetical protein
MLKLFEMYRVNHNRKGCYGLRLIDPRPSLRDKKRSGLRRHLRGRWMP